MRSWPTPAAQSFSQQSFPEVRVPHWEGTAHSRPCQPAPTAAQKPALSSWTPASFLPHNTHKSWQLHRSLQDIVEQNKLARKKLLLATPYLPLALYLLSSCLEISSTTSPLKMHTTYPISPARQISILPPPILTVLDICQEQKMFWTRLI